ncbi:hypothetical protein ARMGADRAFT_1020149 [Armillaria gallica]|uniref:Uncharacterized protein n=1 Tax=Armillaria gallica TaxID=47427 RepID=A0A2H3CKC3_ARMGA|nr:hypothetical protein ARMGADRAFT_1020149 [Armillaria gallica]
MTRLYPAVFLHIHAYVACNTSDVPAILHIVRFLVARLESKNGDAKHYHSDRHCRKASFSIPLLPVLAHAKVVSIHTTTPAYHDVSKSHRSGRDSACFLRGCRPDWSKI